MRINAYVIKNKKGEYWGYDEFWQDTMWMKDANMAAFFTFKQLEKELPKFHDSCKVEAWTLCKVG